MHHQTGGRLRRSLISQSTLITGLWRHTCHSLLPAGVQSRKKIIREKEGPTYSKSFRLLKIGLYQASIILFIASPSGAQFAVTASTVRENLIRDLLERMRSWIIHKALPSMTAGAIFEYLWPYLLLGPNEESCPQEAACYRLMFEVCFDPSDGGSEMANDSLHACYDIFDY